METQGLRERKKRQTREEIANVATALFAELGFENVTIAEVAAAAGVAKMTVTTTSRSRRTWSSTARSTSSAGSRTPSRPGPTASRSWPRPADTTLSSWRPRTRPSGTGA